MTDYKEKYLKYKAKYLDLKAQLGGDYTDGASKFIGYECKNYKIIRKESTFRKAVVEYCECKKFIYKSHTINKNSSESSYCGNCGHSYLKHEH